MANVAVTVVFILFNTIFQTVQYRSSGAPSTQCDSMTPNHDVSAQSDTSPYSVKTEKPYYMPGENVKVSIGSSSTDIKGYLIQARLVGANSATGMFTTLPASGKYVSCGNKRGAVTHDTILSVKTVNFEWQPPLSASGNISFYATVVKDKNAFWVKLKSPELYNREMKSSSKTKSSTPVTKLSSSPSVSLPRTSPVTDPSSSASASSSDTTPMTNSPLSLNVLLLQATATAESSSSLRSSSASDYSSRTTPVTNSSLSVNVFLPQETATSDSSSRTTPVASSFPTPGVTLARTTPLTNSSSSHASVSSSHTTHVISSSPNPSVSSSPSMPVIYSLSSTSVFSSRTTPMLNSNSSRSVSPSPERGNICKVDDAKCDGAQLYYNARLLFFIGFIACILA